MKYVRISSDSDGESHFEDVEIALAPVEYAPPAPALDLSAAAPVRDCRFFSVPADWFGDWHPSPRRQFCFVTSGRLEAATSDGETREFGPGEVVLLEDTFGRGHTTRAVGGAASGVFVALAT
jgi:hypothetical protein